MCVLFLRDHYLVPVELLILWIIIHPNVDSTTSIEYWSKVAEVPKTNIRVSTAVSSASLGKRPIHSLPYGTCHLRIQKASLSRAVQGWLRGIKQQVRAELAHR